MPRSASLIPCWVLGLSLAAGCGGEGAPPPAADTVPDSEAWEGDLEATARLVRPRGGTEDDWRILREKASWAWEAGLDTLPIGESMARIGLSFVGTPYVPNTLELAGDESLVVNLQELDCVTLVENVLALAHFIREGDPEILTSEQETRDLYRRILTRIRYRAGIVDGYASRLHYFSEWILDNEAEGLIREVTGELGGIEDPRPVDFMSTHPEAYRQLANPPVLHAVRETERYLGSLTRYRIPEEEIATWSRWIQDGDIIAVTSTTEGLDVGHTGLAVRRDGALHLLHAPIVGESVEVSTLPLADRILRLKSQDGIRVVRPLEPGDASAVAASSRGGS